MSDPGDHVGRYARFGDFDEDGRIDLFATNGMTRDFSDSDLRAQLKTKGDWQQGDLDFWKKAPLRKERNLAFRNLGDLAFESAGVQWGLDALGVSFGAATGDLDGDGDLDLVVNEFEGPPRVYRNRTSGTHRVVVRLHGYQGNSHGVGAQVVVVTAAGRQTRDLPSSGGFMSADAPALHFGLGEADRVKRLEVRWPDGRADVFEDIPADQHYTVQWAAEVPRRAIEEMRPLAFGRPAPLAPGQHAERPFDDFERQPLLPVRHSAMGPGVAMGDVDGDGREDIFYGGAAGQPGALFRGTASGYARMNVDALAADAASEDLGAVFFDADRDGDLDLYVVSGGVEGEPGDAVFRDRLYLNDGAGGLQRSADAVPDLRDSGGPVTAGDLDGDGDLDLFVGGRVVPGLYPTAPSSRLLRNDGGKLVDVTDAVAPGLREAGMVTGAVFADADADGDVDLVVAYEWDHIHLWQNDGGRLADASDRVALDSHAGWWNSVAVGDLDGDGDLDLVTGNVGLNTRYHAGRDHPTSIYHGPLGPGGTHRIIEAEYEGTTLFPVRGRSCSSAAIPELADKFPTYRAFASAELTEIYGDPLDEARKLTADTLSSGAWINDDGRYRFVPFPRLAQIAPADGIALLDYDQDGHLDAYLAQNSYAPQRETGRWAGGVGQLLRGRGDGTFEAVPAERSGLVVPSDGTAAIAADNNQDGRPDLVLGINDSAPVVFPAVGDGRRGLAVRLAGPAGNPTGVGATVQLTVSGGRTLSRPVVAGGGYLSQPPATVWFGIPDGQSPKTVAVTWPDGQRTEQSLTASNAAPGATLVLKPRVSPPAP